MPTSHGEAAVPSEKRWCYVCAQEVWVSFTMCKIMVDEPELQALCVECAPGVLETEKDPQISVHPAILAEVKKHYERNKNDTKS